MSLYEEVLRTYGFYIVLAGVGTFLIAGLIVVLIFKSSNKFSDGIMFDEITCNALVVSKGKGKMVEFEIESGERIKLKLKKLDYDYLFIGTAGILTYIGEKFISFENSDEE